MDENRPGVFSVYGKKDGERRFIGCWYSFNEAVGIASTCAQLPEPRYDACYVKEFGVGTVHFENRSHAMLSQDRKRQAHQQDR